jgi:hypothetical protein
MDRGSGSTKATDQLFNQLIEKEERAASKHAKKRTSHRHGQVHDHLLSDTVWSE